MKKILLALMCVLAAVPAAAVAHKGNPNYLSEIADPTPAGDGIRVEMINRDDRILLTNRSGKDVLVLGYEDEPYARIQGDGAVLVNLNSPAHHLNEDRFGTRAVPATARKGAEPRWKPITGSGRFEWHDHRAHWMGKGRPPQVEDPGRRTEIFDWSVPLEVDGRRAAVTGTLFWTPLPGGGAPTGAIVAGAAVLIALCAAMVAVRRRRDGGATPAGAEAEAW